MSWIYSIAGILSVSSLLFSALMLREFVVVTRRRRELIAALGGSGKAVPSLKHTLMTIYGLSSVLWVIGLVMNFFWIINRIS